MNDFAPRRIAHRPPAPPRPADGRAGIALALAIWAALAAHMLFIPYAYAPLSFEGALMRFGDIEWLRLGSDQNIALVSRALTWLPIGLLGAATVAPTPRRTLELPALLTGAMLGLLWALLVNFCQLWFPARTFSLNNLAAEACGGLVGAALWGLCGASATRWLRRLRTGMSAGAKAALQCYVVVYLIAILTPFDFMTSAADLAEKIGQGQLYAWWVAPVGCGPTSCGAKWVAVILSCIPCGWWFADLRRNERHVWLPAVTVAIVVGAAVESLHFLMVSGMTQGASIAARALGMGLGALSWASVVRLSSRKHHRSARAVVLVALPFYLAIIFYLSGWLRSERLAVPDGWQRLGQVSWMPFYQEYYSSYQATMASLMSQALIYAAIGVAAWLCARDRSLVNGLHAAAVAGALCFLAESSKLWLVDRLPDYTNVLIAAFAAFAATAILRFGNATPEQPFRRLRAAPRRS